VGQSTLCGTELETGMHRGKTHREIFTGKQIWWAQAEIESWKSRLPERSAHLAQKSKP
jgi:hypothetical protein